MALNTRLAGLQLPDSEKPVRMTILNPYDERDPLIRNDTNEECWIEILPPFSETGKSIERRQLDKNLRKRINRVSVEDVQENIIERLAGLTKAWSLAFPDGTPIPDPYSYELAKAIYGEVDWLRNQVSNFISDLGNFRPTASEISLTMQSGISDSAV